MIPQAQVYLLLFAAVLGTTNAQNYWFSFGDSYTQTAFNTTRTLPSVGNPLGNPPYPGETSTGGENWLCAWRRNDLRRLMTPELPTILSLTDQVNQFLTNYAARPSTTPWASENTLFSVWIGINDILNTYYLGGDRDAFSDTLVDAYIALMEELVLRAHLRRDCNVGARNFLFLNVPPFDRSPFTLALSTSSQALEKSVIEGFNSRLATRAAALGANHSDVKTWIWDSNAAFTAILDDPTSYGFQDVTSYGDADGLFWRDSLHPTSDAHALFSQDVAKLLGGFM
ncbi:uncharacterized protein EV420DRAFT_1714419 [Desarmillaria tabescens]|uniref:Carbohydrate esterase family 16 protein n=1 Tax=Armillaria tabescens TaxID=1929756 RepID=A0AA39JQB1_ARMTA|nr:uncharacterized protein EV420DRAFT_1714419 [Desarmillaria tabescens]KAK0446962.1 hypothetical protein EV420DRAFT_1714419 [Desarmillaria tabescens]